MLFGLSLHRVSLSENKKGDRLVPFEPDDPDSTLFLQATLPEGGGH